MHNGATLGVENAQTWAHEIQVDSATLNIRGKQTYLADDLVLKGQGKTEVSISGNLNLFGNPETLKSAQCASEVVEKRRTVQPLRWQIVQTMTRLRTPVLFC